MRIARPVVFPLFGIVHTPKGSQCACGREDCGRVGKHPAVSWGDVIYGGEVPRPEPGAGVGLKTGAHPKGSDVIVVDIDGPDAFEALVNQVCPLPDTLEVTTGRGAHLYFKHPGFPVRNSAGELAKGVDIRGDGGFVVAPGSPHKSGATYELFHDVEPAPAPDWLITWLKARPASEEIQTYPGDVAEGSERDHRRALYTEFLKTAPACVQGSAGDQRLFEVVQRGAYDLQLPTADVLALVREHFDPRCQPPWGDELEERVVHKAHSAKTQSTRPRAEPWPADLAHLVLPTPPPATINLRRISAATRALRVGGYVGARLKTGFPSIDNATRGGILPKKLVVVGGAPGAGKTALLVRVGFQWLAQGVPVAVLAADEEAEALLIRFGQLAGLSRESLENGDVEARKALAVWCDSVPLILADGDEDNATIESVSADLKQLGANGVLLVDSMQTARIEELPKGLDARTRINETVRTLKRAAKVDGHLVMASSEISKAAYRNKDQAENINALSAFKESGDIEYGVSFALVLTNRQGTSDLVDATVVKNRLGPGKPEFMLRLDHDRANVSEISAADVEKIDPLYFVKQDVKSAIETAHGAALSRNSVISLVGGNRQTVLKAINELINAHVLFDSKEGVRYPLPGEPGYEESRT